MGVDAGIFAKRAKKYFWFDRHYNCHGWSYVNGFWKDDNEGECLEAERVYDRINVNAIFTSPVEEKDALFMFDLSRQAWLTATGDLDSHRAIWCEKVIEFIKAHPGDTYFIATDHGNAYDLIGSMNGNKGDLWTGEYMEWKS